MFNPTIPVYFDWQQASGDPRQYNQQRTLLAPRAVIAVDVPLKHEYIHNAEDIIQTQLSGGEKIKPVLTPAGMVYCDNALVAAYNEARQAEKEELKQEVESDEIEWTEGAEFDEDDEDAGWVTDAEDELESIEALEDEEDLDEIVWQQ